MKKLGIFLLFFLILASCSNGSNTMVSNTPQSAEPTRSSEIGKNPFTDIKTSYFQDENFMQCSRQAIDSCITSQVGIDETLTLETCDDLFMQENKESCKRSVTTTQARVSGDIKLCDTLDDPDSCKFELLVAEGTETQNTQVCEELNETLQASCNNIIVRTLRYDTLDEKYCDQIVVDLEGDDLETLKQNCIRETSDMKRMQDEALAQEQDQILEQQRLENIDVAGSVTSPDNQEESIEVSVDEINTLSETGTGVNIPQETPNEDL